MASELYVETLKGLTSGANANKVIIPSGQTLDISGSWSPPAGTVLQVVRAFKDTQTAFGSGGFTWIDTGLEGAITPSSTSSKILIMLSFAGYTAADTQDNNFRLKYSTDGKSTSAIVNPSTNANSGDGFNMFPKVRGGMSTNGGARYNYTTLHSPNTTNQVDYWMQGISEGTFYFNEASQVGLDRFGSTVSEIILMEIAG